LAHNATARWDFFAALRGQGRLRIGYVDRDLVAQAVLSTDVRIVGIEQLAKVARAHFERRNRRRAVRIREDVPHPFLTPIQKTLLLSVLKWLGMNKDRQCCIQTGYSARAVMRGSGTVLRCRCWLEIVLRRIRRQRREILRSALGVMRIWPPDAAVFRSRNPR